MFLAAMLFAGMGAFAFQAHQLDSALSPLVSTTIRVLMNALLVAFWALRTRQSALPSLKQSYLWGFGFFGAITISTHFASLRVLGNGETSFLQAIQGVVIAALAPWVLKQRSKGLTWGWLFLSLAGMVLLIQPSAHTQWLGVSLGLISGTAAAAAYLCIARQGESVSILKTMGSWSVCSFALMLGLVPWLADAWPKTGTTWFLLIIAGLFAAVGQYASAVAFSRGPATQVAIVGYTGPVFAYFLDWLCFRKEVNVYNVFGAVLIVCCSFAARGTVGVNFKNVLSQIVPSMRSAR